MPVCSPGRPFHAMGPGDLGGTQNISSDPVSPNAVRCRHLVDTSVDDPAVFLPQGSQVQKLNFSIPACSPGRHLQGTGSANFGEIREISGHPVSSNGVRFRDLPGTSFDDPAGHACSPARHLHGMGPGDFEGTRKVSDDPVSPMSLPLPRGTGCFCR